MGDSDAVLCSAPEPPHGDWRAAACPPGTDWHESIRADAATGRPVTTQGQALLASSRPWTEVDLLIGECSCGSSLCFERPAIAATDDEPTNDRSETERLARAVDLVAEVLLHTSGQTITPELALHRARNIVQVLHGEGLLQ